MCILHETSFLILYPYKKKKEYKLLMGRYKLTVLNVYFDKKKKIDPWVCLPA